MSAACMSDADPRWTPTPISKHGKTSVTLSTQTCKTGYILGHRYAWRESPCVYKNCAVYSEENELPAPPYIQQKPLNGDSQWHKVQFGE